MTTRAKAWLTTGADRLDAGLTGNKFARLVSMRAAGFPVPDLFCLSAQVFDAVVGPVVERLPAAPTVSDDAAVRRWSHAAIAAVNQISLPLALALEVEAALDDLVSVGGLVAVRACAVPHDGQAGEDGADDPFAGLSESFLDVSRTGLISRIVACWASAFTPEGVLYRLRKGMDPAATRMAVGVQRMIPGAQSFVAFTRDPRDGADRHVIAAAHGSGEGVVREESDVDHYFVEDGDIRAEIVPKPQGPALRDDQVRQIVALAERIERHFGAPQDIEGVFGTDGTLHIVQSRPLVPPAAPVAEVQWSNHNITESYPGVASALTYSVARDFYRLTFADLYRRMGVPERVIRRNSHHLERMVGMLDGRIFYRLDAWFALHGMLPQFEIIRGWWERGMGLAEVPSRPRWRPRVLPGLARRMLRHPTEVRDFLDWWDSIAATADRIEEATPDELVAFYRRLWTEVGARWGVTLTNTVLFGVVAVVADDLMTRWARPDLLTGLLSGGRENRSLAAMRSTLALAELINTNDHAREDVLSSTSGAWARLAGGVHGDTLADAANTHLRRYGDRAPADLKIEQVTPRQRPDMITDVIRPMVRQRHTVARSRADELRVRRETERELRRLCPNPIRRTVLKGLAAAMRGFVTAREDTRFCRTELYGITRRVMLRLGADLAAAGHLDRPEDVIDLTVQEVLGAFEGTAPGPGLRALAADRRINRELHASLPAPPARQVTTANTPLAEPRPVPVPEQLPGQDVLRGLASSPGVVRARAKVVTDSTIPPESCQDRILIARETDPGWLFLMLAAKGLVVERGTLLSHTAITGRLLGVPTVVAVPGATTGIPDGAWIELDGTSGTVRLLDVS